MKTMTSPAQNVTSQISNKRDAITIEHVQNILLILCDLNRWKHEASKYIAAGSSDPYHIASIVWKQLGNVILLNDHS
jgi:hypothetical protein